jgi:hypothetical protein
MLLCSNCPDKFTEGQVCVKCSRLFCVKHKITSCPFCNGSLEKLSIDIEKSDKVVVQWLVLRDLKNLGVAQIDKLPSYTINVMNKMSSGNRNLKIIFFPSKADSIEYEKTILQKQGLTQPDRVISESSRYTIIFLATQESLTYLLLNEKAIEESTIDFLIELFTRIFAKIEDYKGVLEKRDDKLIKAFGEALFSYTKKMAIPFVYADEMIRGFVRFTIQNVQLSYLECSVLREMVNEGVYINGLADYLEYKIRTNLETFDYEMRFQLVEVYQTLDTMLLVATLMSSISNHEPLSQLLTNLFKRDFDDFRLRYSELPDLLRAIDLIFANKAKITFSSYDEYIRAISELIHDAFCEIEARYVTLGEGLALLKLSEFYLDGLEDGQHVLAPHIGSIDNFVELLEGIFNREAIYPEVRIMAGMALEHVLFTWTFMDHDFSRFLKLVDCTKRFCKLVERSLPEIRKKNGALNGFTGSPLTYEDGALKLLSTSKMARSFGDLVTEKELVDIAEEIAEKYDLPSIKVDLWWARFVGDQDFSYLPKIHEAARRINFGIFPYLKYTALPVDLLAQALLYEEDVESKIRYAQELVLDGSSETLGQSVYVTQSIQTAQALFSVFEIFKRLLMSTKCRDNLREAYYTSLALREILAKTDIINIIALKTEILYKLTKQDFSAASNLCEELSRYLDPQGNIKLYKELALKWIGICKNEPERRYVHQKEFHYDGNDIWIQILLSFVRESMEDDLSKNISGSKAIVFVEGETDALVLKEFASKLFPNTKVSFIDIEGYTNYHYYIEAKMTKELRIPCYLILDGDTTEKKKTDLVKRFGRISLGRESIYTLQRHSIENYLLIPRAIKTAFPNMSLSEKNIERFLLKNRLRKNKKLVLEALFEKAGLEAYDKNCAKRIALAFNNHEIKAELAHLLTRICNLQKLQWGESEKLHR